MGAKAYWLAQIEVSGQMVKASTVTEPPSLKIAAPTLDGSGNICVITSYSIHYTKLYEFGNNFPTFVLSPDSLNSRVELYMPA